MDVWAYFEQRERELQELSLVPDGDFLVAAEAGSDDKRGRIFGRTWLMDNAYLQVHEVVVVVDNHIRREEYGYFLVIDGEEVWGFERDPTHDPPVHRHSAGHERHDFQAISFKEAVERAWEEVTSRAQFPVE